MIGFRASLVGLVACAACATSHQPAHEPLLRLALEEAPAVLAQAPAEPVRALRPFDGWSTLEPAAFEKALASWTDERGATRLDDAALADLTRSLDSDTARVAVRAALLLARSGDPRAAGALLARLERRVSSGSETTDVVAGAGLARLEASSDTTRRLHELADGRRPHPRLAVRVECAASGLALGSDVDAGFLLDVLREATPDARRAPSWKRAGVSDDELEWLQSRAARALSLRARVPLRYRPEAPVEERRAEATHLESLVRPAPRSGG